MQSRLKKTLYLSLAVFSLGAVTAVSSTTASAKTYATAGAYQKLMTDATKRNVEATGTNALYTKPGTVKGAKVVASKATMTKLASSKKSADYFRAYGVKTTNRGSVYYRVVTMDGKYRGYIYGGSSNTVFAGGIKSAETMTKSELPKEKTVYFANPGKKNVTWDAPYQTQYKANKQVKDTTPFAADKLTITDAAKKTREGTLYYYVKDASNPSISGWIYSEAVTTNAKTAFNRATDVKINLAYNGNIVASGVLQGLKADGSNKPATIMGTSVGTDVEQKATASDGTNLSWVNSELKGTGYSYDASSNANKAALLAAKTGDTVTLTVKKGGTVTSTMKLYDNVKSGLTTTSTPMKNVNAEKYNSDAKDKTKLDYATYGKQIAVFPALTTGFKGTETANFSADDLANFANNNKLATLYSPTFYVKESGKTDAATAQSAVPAHVKYTLVSTDKGTYGEPASLYYSSEIVYGSVSPVKVASASGSTIFAK